MNLLRFNLVCYGLKDESLVKPYFFSSVENFENFYNGLLVCRLLSGKTVNKLDNIPNFVCTDLGCNIPYHFLGGNINVSLSLLKLNSCEYIKDLEKREVEGFIGNIGDITIRLNAMFGHTDPDYTIYDTCRYQYYSEKYPVSPKCITEKNNSTNINTNLYKSDDTLPLIIGSGVTFFVIVVVCFLICINKRKCQCKDSNNSNLLLNSTDSQEYNFNAIELKPLNNLSNRHRNRLIEESENPKETEEFLKNYNYEETSLTDDVFNTLESKIEPTKTLESKAEPTNNDLITTVEIHENF